MSRSEHPRGYDGISESPSSPTEREGISSPTKIDRPDFPKRNDIDPSKKHVSVTVPGAGKAKAPAKKKKVAPTLVRFVRFLSCEMQRPQESNHTLMSIFIGCQRRNLEMP